MGEAGLFDEDPQRREKRAAFLGGSERILDYLPESRAGQDVAHDPGNAVSDDYLRCWLTQIDPNDQVLVLAVGLHGASIERSHRSSAARLTRMRSRVGLRAKGARRCRDSAAPRSPDGTSVKQPSGSLPGLPRFRQRRGSRVVSSGSLELEP